jgi:hypothetical protein
LNCFQFHCTIPFVFGTLLAGEIRRLLDESFEVLLKSPFNLAVDSFGRLVISCLEDCTIFRFDPSAPANHQLTCIAGKSGQQSFIDGDGPTQALLGAVSGIAIDPWDTIFFADYSHGAIRAVAPNGLSYCLATFIVSRHHVWIFFRASVFCCLR